MFKDLCKCSVNNIRKMSSVQDILKDVFLKSVEAVQPSTLIKSQVQVTPGHLSVQGRTFPLRKPLYMVGFGKAVQQMARDLEQSLKDQLEMGIVTIPHGSSVPATNKSKVIYIEGAKNNLPDEEAMEGALQIKRLIENLSQDDLLLVLISGGGSALLPLPIPPITLSEKQDLIKELSTRGADIKELNCVRKQISVLKGGGLAELAYPCRVISLILSDIVGDPLDFIASGPTVPNLDENGAAAEVMRKYNLSSELIPNSVRATLSRQKKTACPVIKYKDGGTTRTKYEHVENFVIGNNCIAAQAAYQHAVSLGFQSAIISTSITGNVAQISRIYTQLARDLATNPASFDPAHPDYEIFDSVSELATLDPGKKMVIVAAGEPTVVVKGGGKGGRNQQLALEFSLRLNELEKLQHNNGIKADISFLSAGTDGIDGPTDAAGAIGGLDLVNNCLVQDINPWKYLEECDSYSFYSDYRGGECLIKIGHTGTNVMDIHLMLIEPRMHN